MACLQYTGIVVVIMCYLPHASLLAPLDYICMPGLLCSVTTVAYDLDVARSIAVFDDLDLLREGFPFFLFRGTIWGACSSGDGTRQQDLNETRPGVRVELYRAE